MSKINKQKTKKPKAKQQKRKKYTHFVSTQILKRDSGEYK
jgi:hypothetical protein